MRRLLLSIAGLLILLAVAVPAGAIYYAAFTESGLKFIVSLVPREFAGVRLDIVNPSGTIAHGIHLERVEIDHHLVHLRVDGFNREGGMLGELLTCEHALFIVFLRLMLSTLLTNRIALPTMPSI